EMRARLLPGLLQRDRRGNGFTRRRILQRLGLGNQRLATRDFGAARGVAPLLERSEDLVEALAQRALALRRCGRSRVHAPGGRAARRLELLVRPRVALDPRAPR